MLKSIKKKFVISYGMFVTFLQHQKRKAKSGECKRTLYEVSSQLAWGPARSTLEAYAIHIGRQLTC